MEGMGGGGGATRTTAGSPRSASARVSAFGFPADVARAGSKAWTEMTWRVCSLPSWCQHDQPVRNVRGARQLSRSARTSATP